MTKQEYQGPCGEETVNGDDNQRLQKCQILHENQTQREGWKCLIEHLVYLSISYWWYLLLWEERWISLISEVVFTLRLKSILCEETFLFWRTFIARPWGILLMEDPFSNRLSVSRNTFVRQFIELQNDFQKRQMIFSFFKSCRSSHDWEIALKFKDLVSG